jgi:hypothetical protein
MHLLRNQFVSYMVATLSPSVTPTRSSFPAFMARGLDIKPYELKIINSDIEFMGKLEPIAYFESMTLNTVSTWKDEGAKVKLAVAAHRLGLNLPNSLYAIAINVLNTHLTAEQERETTYHNEVAQAISIHPASVLAETMARRNRIAAMVAQAEALGQTLAPHLMNELGKSAPSRPVERTNDNTISW